MNIKLRDELLRRVYIDQAQRKVPLETMRTEQWRQKLTEIDEDNTAWLKLTVEQFGWPAVSLVGDEASHAAWLLVQHADHDRPFQAKCLELMRVAAPGEVQPAGLAYLEDRLLAAEGKPLKYGTQFVRAADDSAWVPQAIDDPDHVDERRAAMGLSTLAKNIAEINSPEGSRVSNLKRHRG